MLDFYSFEFNDWLGIISLHYVHCVTPINYRQNEVNSVNITKSNLQNDANFEFIFRNEPLNLYLIDRTEPVRKTAKSTFTVFVLIQ